VGLDTKPNPFGVGILVNLVQQIVNGVSWQVFIPMMNHQRAAIDLCIHNG
jgi:hypothetical protein